MTFLYYWYSLMYFMKNLINSCLVLIINFSDVVSFRMPNSLKLLFSLNASVIACFAHIVHVQWLLYTVFHKIRTIWLFKILFAKVILTDCFQIFCGRSEGNSEQICKKISNFIKRLLRYVCFHMKYQITRLPVICTWYVHKVYDVLW